MTELDFDRVTEEYRRALLAIVRGNPDAYKQLYSEAEDITLANPYGGVVRGRDQVWERLEQAASNYRDGELVGVETITRHLGSDFAYTVEIERFRTKVAGSDDFDNIAIRVTSIFVREAEEWKLAHRHADPRVSLLQPELVFRSTQAS